MQITFLLRNVAGGREWKDWGWVGWNLDKDLDTGYNIVTRMTWLSYHTDKY